VSTPTAFSWRDAAELAQAVAGRLTTRLVTAQAARGHACLVLTGGGVGIAALAALADSPGRDSIDWGSLDSWWSDERFVRAEDPERNERQARDALLDRVPIEQARIHPMPAAGSVAAGPDGDDVHAAARAYADELARHASIEAHAPVPHIDVLLLGVGPDGHVASLFPNAPALRDARTVVGVEGAPKPPPRRITMTPSTIRCADAVWLVAAGGQKAPAVGLALSGAGAMSIPAAAVTGRHETRWLLDHDAAAELPTGFVRAT